MLNLHEIVGTLVIVAFAVLLVVNILRAMGRRIGFAKQLSFIASGLLMFQYVLGFGLLGGNHTITAWHYLIAFSALIPVGAEHGMANSKLNPREAGRVGALANLGTLIIVLITYMIGMNNT